MLHTEFTSLSVNLHTCI